MPSLGTILLGLTYWKEHRHWAAEVISNEIPRDVKVKYVYSCIPTARKQASPARGPFSSPPGLLNVRSNLSPDRLCSLLESFQNWLSPSTSKCNLHPPLNISKVCSRNKKVWKKGNSFPPILTKQRSEIAMYYKPSCSAIAMWSMAIFAIN